MLLLRNKDQR